MKPVARATRIASGVTREVTAAATSSASGMLSSGCILDQPRRHDATLVGDDVVDRVVQRQHGRPAGQVAQRARVRTADPQLLESGGVGILVWDELDLALGAGTGDHA